MSNLSKIHENRLRIQLGWCPKGKAYDMHAMLSSLGTGKNKISNGKSSVISTSSPNFKLKWKSIDTISFILNEFGRTYFSSSGYVIAFCLTVWTFASATHSFWTTVDKRRIKLKSRRNSHNKQNEYFFQPMLKSIFINKLVLSYPTSH